jgi:AbrB family looped-hinge helix DNA binding protein
MPTATMTSKGQITIPIEVRKALGLKPGVRIDFYESVDGAFVLRPKTGSIRDLEGCVPKLSYAPTIEEMDEVIAEHVAALDRATMSDIHESAEEGEAA